MAWLNKHQAAAASGLSVRTVLHLANEKTVKTRKERDTASGQMATFFDSDELVRYATRRHVAAVPPPAPEPAAAAEPEPAAVALRADPLEAVREIVRTFAPAPPVPLWLTLDQAAAYSGLPVSALKKFIVDASLSALDVGVRPGGKYRIKRADLDAI